MTIWQPGMRCVCIKDVYVDESLGFRKPIKGTVYTVRRTGVCNATGLAVLSLVEIDNSHAIGSVVLIGGYAYRVGSEPGFGAHHFRPLSERRLDQFREHLVPAGVDPDAAPHEVKPRQKSEAA